VTSINTEPTRNAIDVLNDWKQHHDDLTAKQIVDGLAAVGIGFRNDGEKLIFERGGATPEMLDIIARHEPEILKLVKPSETMPQPVVEHAPAATTVAERRAQAVLPRRTGRKGRE
jgi:hypothetical protein